MINTFVRCCLQVSTKGSLLFTSLHATPPPHTLILGIAHVHSCAHITSCADPPFTLPSLFLSPLCHLQSFTASVWPGGCCRTRARRTTTRGPSLRASSSSAARSSPARWGLGVHVCGNGVQGWGCVSAKDASVPRRFRRSGWHEGPPCSSLVSFVAAEVPELASHGAYTMLPSLSPLPDGGHGDGPAAGAGKAADLRAVEGGQGQGRGLGVLRLQWCFGLRHCQDDLGVTCRARSGQFQVPGRMGGWLQGPANNQPIPLELWFAVYPTRTIRYCLGLSCLYDAHAPFGLLATIPGAGGGPERHGAHYRLLAYVSAGCGKLPHVLQPRWHARAFLKILSLLKNLSWVGCSL